MLYNYFAVAFLAVHLSVAAPRNHAQDALQPCHGNVVDTETIPKPEYGKQHDNMRKFEQDYREILTDIGIHTNTATKIAGEAGKLGSSEDVFQKVINDLDDQSDAIQSSLGNLFGSSPIVGGPADRVIDAFELLSHGLEGEFDIFKYKSDVINADNSCEEIRAYASHVFVTYYQYHKELKRLFVDSTQRKTFTDLIEDPTSNHNDLMDTLKCKTSNLQSAIKSSWRIVVDLL